MTLVSSISRTRFAQHAVCAAAVAGAVLLPLAVPKAVSAFTVGQTNTSGGITRQGQQFVPSNLGPNGSGTAPASGIVFLNSFTFAYNAAGNRTVNVLYIYSSLPTSTALSTGTGALFTSTGFTDSASTDARFNTPYPSRTFNFASVPLDVNTTYYALLPSSQGFRESGGNPYTGGDELYVSGTSIVPDTGWDLSFIADFSPVPVPFVFNPIFYLGWFGLSQARKALRDRRSTGHKTLAKV